MLVSHEDIAPVLAIPFTIIVTIAALRAITIPSLDLVSNFVGVMFRPLRQCRSRGHSQAD